MGLFSNWKDKRRERRRSPEYLQILAFQKDLDGLLAQDRYIARRDYKPLTASYAPAYAFFGNLVKSGMLSKYCRRGCAEEADVKAFMPAYEDLMDLKKGSARVAEHNEAFISRHLEQDKGYLDSILAPVDRNIVLDEEQREAVLADEDYTLIIAGAGAGKTTTVAAKVRYLTERQGVDPRQILVVSFTNKAVGELRERINNLLGIPCPITTFHSCGNAILRKKEETMKKVVSDGYLFWTVNNYLKSKVLTDPALVDKSVMFFSSYFEAPYEGEDLNQFFNYVAKADFSTLKSNLNEYSREVIDRFTHRRRSIQNEILRSRQEVEIANFLYMHKIDYTYEEIYPYNILKARKPYTPDFCIRQDGKTAYIEHFGISESGRSTRYTPDQLAQYKSEIRDKVALHKQHGTKLLCTWSSYNDGRTLTDHLKETLERAGFRLEERPAEEVLKKLVSTEENRYIYKLVRLITTFITNFKTNDLGPEDFDRFKKDANVRTKLFMDICKGAYLEYEKKLSEDGAVDYEDMINDSARAVNERLVSREMLNFRYIIVDEYQDISRQRFDLTKALSELCEAKVIAVGDDWQSIYAFSGSDITLFTHFTDIMGYGDIRRITRTYRNAQEVIDIAGGFIQKNEAQIQKSLVSPKHISQPVVIYTYSEDPDLNSRDTAPHDRGKPRPKGGKYALLGKTVEDLIGRILRERERQKQSPYARILLIGRFNFDARNLCFSEDFLYDEDSGKVTSKKYPRARLEFMTAHSSKGLGYDDVIIVNARNETYGFPSKIEDDPVMKYVVKEDRSIEYAEERRLFYVAMTRTKNRVFIVSPAEHPSEFVLELMKDYPSVTQRGDINTEPSRDMGRITSCPVCGYPLQLRYNPNYGMALWMCSNEPEICTYITNSPEGGKMSIQKCDRCRDGYLIIKKSSTGNIFLGCTNYSKDGTGCNRTVSQTSYDFFIHSGFETDKSVDMRAFITSGPKPSKPAPESHKTPATAGTLADKPQAPKTAAPKPRTERRSGVNEVMYVKCAIYGTEYELIATPEGALITDADLLAQLDITRRNIAKATGKSPLQIVSNKALVNLATYRPEGKEEFVSLAGLGEETYKSYGKPFINTIKAYISKSAI
ncbi:MAG: UvrD-helicase domain-containing protein [Clostridia bacterium]|nr:UvrD-helicase domain-containing protein [Clostridia bacterium]